MRLTIFLFTAFVSLFTTVLLWDVNPNFHSEDAKTAIFFTSLIKVISQLYMLAATLDYLYREIKSHKNDTPK